MVDLDGHPGTPDRPGNGQVGAFPQDSSVQQGMTWRFTVAIDSDVTWAMTSRPIGPRNRTARKTDDAAASEAVARAPPRGGARELAAVRPRGDCASER